jgi:hypothetical protein
MTTTLEEINDLYEIAEFMEDPELTQALEFIAKVIFKPDVPINVVTTELVRMQAIAAKMAMRATWMANVDKSNRAKKNIYYTAAEQIDKVCSSLKYLTKG